jgi:hypothetical protein
VTEADDSWYYILEFVEMARETSHFEIPYLDVRASEMKRRVFVRLSGETGPDGNSVIHRAAFAKFCD